MDWFIDRAKYLIIAAMVVVTAVLTALLGKVLQVAPALPLHLLMALMMMLMGVSLVLMLIWFNEHRATERTALMWHMQVGFVLAGVLWWLMLGLSLWMLALLVVMVTLLMCDESIAEPLKDDLEADK